MKLTDREHQVLTHLADGKPINEIAAALYISPATVKIHTEKLRTKLGARNAAHVVAIAYRTGLLGGTKEDT